MKLTKDELIGMLFVPGVNREQIIKELMSEHEVKSSEEKIFMVLGDVARNDADNIHGVFRCRKRAEQYKEALERVLVGYNSFTIYEVPLDE